MTAEKRVTTDDICVGLRRQYAAPRYALLFEVRDSTGFDGPGRTADAIVMGCWPSMGRELHGIEIKQSRTDWQKELAKPQKAESVASYCDRWSVVTAPNVIRDVSEVPPAWGWMEFDGKRFSTKREATRNKEPKPISRTFLAAMLRCAHATNGRMVEAEIGARTKGADELMESRIAERVKERSKQYVELLAVVRHFEEASGIKLIEHESWHYLTTTDGQRVGALLGLLLKGNNGIYSKWGRGIGSLVETLEFSLKQIKQFQDELGLAELEESGRRL